MKKIIIFDVNPLYNDHILKDCDLKKYLLQEPIITQKKSVINLIIIKFKRFILYLKFFYLIKFLGVKLVVCTIYNSLLISKMIKLYPEVNFLVVQHYTTFEHEQKNLKKLNLGVFFCFGEYQKKLIQQKHNTKNIKLIGSTTLSIYKTLKPQNINEKFKICYISQWTKDSLLQKNNLTMNYIQSILSQLK